MIVSQEAAAKSLLSAAAVRERAHRMLALGDRLPNFRVDLSRLDHTALGRATPRPFADWMIDNVDGPNAAPDAYFIALDGARLVGCTSVTREGDDTVRIALTGVLPAYRRRGIARALKLRLHAWARSAGIREIHTTVTSLNPAMLALNDALGYPIVGSAGGYELRL